MTIQDNSSDSFTLDPPGSIAVIGAGPLGIEAALYGRFLGYNIRIFEANQVGCNLPPTDNLPLPFLPDRSLSKLAVQALKTQREISDLTFPTTINDWIDGYLRPITATDLLIGRLFLGCKVTNIDLEPIDSDDEVSEEEVPADFRITYSNAAGAMQTELFEAVILATGSNLTIETSMTLDTPYLFRIGGRQTDDWEKGLAEGLQDIVATFAELGGRQDLDLYRPSRS